MDATETIYEGETGSVHSSADVSVYLPDSLSMPIPKAIPQAVSRSLETPDGAVRLATEPEAARSHPIRATLLAVLFERLPAFRFRHSDASATSPTTARVPVQVAAAGDRPLACYLAVQGFSDAQIAEMMGIDESTVATAIDEIHEQAK
jgi:DNA-binding NarL/FixJ family response regulator